MKGITFIIICIIIMSFHNCCFSQEKDKKEEIKNLKSLIQSDKKEESLNEIGKKDYIGMYILQDVIEEAWRHPDRVKYIWSINLYRFIGLLYRRPINLYKFMLHMYFTLSGCLQASSITSCNIYMPI